MIEKTKKVASATASWANVERTKSSQSVLTYSLFPALFRPSKTRQGRRGLEKNAGREKGFCFGPKVNSAIFLKSSGEESVWIGKPIASVRQTSETSKSTK